MSIRDSNAFDRSTLVRPSQANDKRDAQAQGGIDGSTSGLRYAHVIAMDGSKLDVSPRLSTLNFDVEKINQSLALVNPFANIGTGSGQPQKRRSVLVEKHVNMNQNQNTNLLVMQITSEESTDDDSELLDISLRDLLNIVLKSANKFDEVLAEGPSNHTNESAPRPVPHHGTVIMPISQQRLPMGPNSVGILMAKSVSVDGLNVMAGDKPQSLTSHGLVTGSVPTVDTFNAVNILRLRDLRRLDFLFNPIDEANVIVR